MVVTAPTSPPRTAMAGIAVSLAIGVAIALGRTINDVPALRSAEAAGFFASSIVAFIAPALLAWLGIRGRPVLLLAAGGLDLVLGLLALPIGIVPIGFAVLFFMAARSLGWTAAGPIRSIAVVLVAAGLGVGAGLALFQHQDPLCYATIGRSGQTVRLDPAPFVHPHSISMSSTDEPAGTTESGCSSDSISTGEAATSIGLVVSMLAACWALTRASPSRH